MEPRFCPMCATPLVHRAVDERERAMCPMCGWIYYAHLKVGAGAIIERDGRLLLLRRARDPFRGCWNLPAGYVEADESPPAAAERETREETGLLVRAESLFGLYFFTDDPRGNGILIVYCCRVRGGSLRESREGHDPTFFARDELPIALAGGGHDRAIADWRGDRQVRDLHHTGDG